MHPWRADRRERTAGLRIEQAFRQRALAPLQLQHFLLEGSERYQAVDEHGLVLADPVAAVPSAQQPLGVALTDLPCSYVLYLDMVYQYVYVRPDVFGLIILI